MICDKSSNTLKIYIFQCAQSAIARGRASVTGDLCCEKARAILEWGNAFVESDRWRNLRAWLIHSFIAHACFPGCFI